MAARPCTLGKKGHGSGLHEDFLGRKAGQSAKTGDTGIILPLMMGKHALHIPLLGALFSPEKQAEQHRLDTKKKNEIENVFSGHQPPRY